MSLFSWLRTRTSTRSPRGRAQHRPAAPRSRPHLEALEARTLPSTYYAATASDLIADINAANKGGGANTIVLTAPTTSPYVLTAVNNTTDGDTVLPVIKKGDSLTILTGNGSTDPGYGDIIDAGRGGRLFDVAPSGSLTLENVTLQNGLALGSGVSAEGGAIYNQGTLVLSQVLLQNNVAEAWFGPYPTNKNPAPPGYDAAGGGVWSDGSLTLENSTVLQGNLAVGGTSNSSGPGGNAFGGGIDIAGGTANITGTTFGLNKAQGGEAGSADSVGGSAYGGAVYVAGGTAILSGDTVGSHAGGNIAQGGAPNGGLWGNGNGGALYVTGGSATLTNDYVISNEAYGWESGGPYTGGIFLAAGATAHLDSFTLYDTYGNTTYYVGSGGSTGGSPAPQIVGTYTLLS